MVVRLNMVTECSPLNQLQSIKIDLKIHTRGPKTDNYSPNVGRSVTLFDLCVLFLMALDNEWLIIIIKLDPRKNSNKKARLTQPYYGMGHLRFQSKPKSKFTNWNWLLDVLLWLCLFSCRCQMCTLHAINFIVARGRFSFAIIGSSFGRAVNYRAGDITISQTL